jgi:hypothetical protein
MAAIKVTIHSTGNGKCSLTEKDGDGLTVSMEDGTVNEQFLSWRAFRQLLAMKANKGALPAAAPKPAPAPIMAVATVPVGNGAK